MITLNKLRVIAKSKFSDKTKLGDWYKKRIEICNSCEYNSSVKKKLSVKDLAIIALNLGKASCLACTCEIAAKASVRSEVCGLEKIGLEPIWRALEDMEEYDFSKIHLENYSPSKIKVYPGAITRLYYGNIKYNSNTEVTISIEGKEIKLSNLHVAVSCGCTSSVTREVNGKFFITLKYDSKRLGEFKKTVSISFMKGDISSHLNFKLEGNVNK